MTVDNIVIPGGMLAARDGPLNTYDGVHDNGPESFNISEVARQRARSLSVSFVGFGPTSEESGPLGDVIVSRRRSQSSLGRHPSGIRGEGRRLQRPQRSSSINLGGLGRSRVTGLSTPANRGLQLDRTPSVFDPARQRVTEASSRFDTIPELESTYVFQRLGNQHHDGNANEASRASQVFLGRNSGQLTSPIRRESSPRKIERSQSNTSQFSSPDVIRRASVAVQNAVGTVKDTVTSALRRSSLEVVYEKAKIRQMQLMRSTAAQIGFEYTFYLVLLAIIYFVFVGIPFWNGLVLTIYYVFDMKLGVPAGTAAFLGVGFLYAYLPLLVLFEKEPPEHSPPDDMGRIKEGQANDTALIIPCYKSEKLIAATLEAALKTFPARNIFVIANGNSPTPLDNTAAVCDSYGVSHTWSPIGSKIIAQYVGCYVVKRFPYVLLIDDDCLLPPNFPIVTDRFTSSVKCIGYTIKSVGPNSSRGTLCQQAQDIEYKISGIQRAFAGKIGSATFPHGAISVWDRELLIKTFKAHPGFSVSEDWFFGHVARQLGCRIQMCTAVFVETETPDAIFFSGGGARGGFGEMTIFKQRFFRWNFFFISGIYYDLAYIFRNWKLGWWELGAKLFVFQEVYETLLYMLAPFVLPISFYVRPSFSGYLFAATLALYMVNTIIFNYVHLRLRHESVTVLCLLYYLPYKIILTFVNIASCYYSIYKYAKYFAKRHPKVIEDEKAVAVVLRLEGESYSAAERAAIAAGGGSVDGASIGPRRFTVTAVGTNLSSVAQQPLQEPADENVDTIDFATQAVPQLAPVPESEASNQFWPLSRIGRMSPPTPAPRRPFSWHRSTSNNSSGSEVSPFDERKTLQFPLPSPEANMEETSSDLDGATLTRRPSPVLFRRSLTSGIRRRSSPDQTAVRTRQPTGIPRLHSASRRPLSTSSSILYMDLTSRNSISARDFPSPPLKPPPPATTCESHEFIVIGSAQDGDDNWPLRTSRQPDTHRYISALADTGNAGWNGRTSNRWFDNVI